VELMAASSDQLQRMTLLLRTVEFGSETLLFALTMKVCVALPMLKLAQYYVAHLCSALVSRMSDFAVSLFSPHSETCVVA